MKTTNKLLLVLACLALLAFSGCTDKKETAQPEQGWQVIDFVWTKENGDKISEEDKTKLNAEIEEDKKVFAGENIDEIKKALEKLTQVSNEVFSKLYQNAGANSGANTGAGSDSGANAGDNIDVKDGDYKTE